MNSDAAISTEPGSRGAEAVRLSGEDETLTRSATGGEGTGADETLTRSATGGGGTRRDETLTRSATGGEVAWMVGLLQVGDSFYPTGSYAHSYGLEGFVQAGVVRDRATLREFIFRAVLPALRQTELPIAVHAWRALGEGDWARVGGICVLASALKTAREARLASENVGRQRAELVANLRGDARAKEFLRRAAENGWPFSTSVSVALEGRALGAPLAAVLSSITYATLAGVVSAAMKLLRIGQNAGQSLLTEALGEAPAITAVAEGVAFEEIGWFNPWLDIAAARHETADARMFIS